MPVFYVCAGLLGLLAVALALNVGLMRGRKRINLGDGGDAEMQAAPAGQMRYTRTARNEVYRQFQRLPNPDLVMYVYPHLAGTDPVPVPGYTTVFPLYQRIQYAMPGERVEDY